MLKIRIPPVQIVDQNNDLIDWSSIKSKYLLLYFYPKDMTPGCTTQACKITESWRELQALDCHVIGISKDSPRRHKTFIEKYDLPFTLLSDPEGKLCEHFDVWIKKSMFGKSYMGIERSSFLFDQNHELLHAWRKVKPADHIADVMAFIHSQD